VAWLQAQPSLRPVLPSSSHNQIYVCERHEEVQNTHAYVFLDFGSRNSSQMVLASCFLGEPSPMSKRVPGHHPPSLSSRALPRGRPQPDNALSLYLNRQACVGLCSYVCDHRLFSHTLGVRLGKRDCDLSLQLHMTISAHTSHISKRLFPVNSREMKRRLGLLGAFLVGAACRATHAQVFDVQAHDLPSLDVHNCLTCAERQVRDR